MTTSSIIIPKADKKLFKLLEEYYQLLQTNGMKELSSKYFHYTTQDDEIQKLISENKENIKKLEKLFKDNIVERNNYASRKRHSNFIDYVIQRDEVPRSKVHQMISDSEKILSNTAFYKFKTESRIMDPFYFIDSRSFDILKDANKLLKKHDVEFYKQLSTIKLVDSNYSSTERLKNDTIVIRARLNSKNIVSFSNFIHELGHAKQLLTITKDPYQQLSRYEKEKFAYEYQLLMLNKYLEEQELDYIKWKMLSKIADAWFEHKIHTESIDAKQAFIKSRKLLFSNIYNDNPIDYLLNVNYQKYAGDSVMRGLIAYELLQ